MMERKKINEEIDYHIKSLDGEPLDNAIKILQQAEQNASKMGYFDVTLNFENIEEYGDSWIKTYLIGNRLETDSEFENRKRVTSSEFKLNILLRQKEHLEKQISDISEAINSDESMKDLILNTNLTFSEKVDWILENYYETGLERIAVEASLKESNGITLEWYGQLIKIPQTLRDIQKSS